MTNAGRSLRPVPRGILSARDLLLKSSVGEPELSFFLGDRSVCWDLGSMFSLRLGVAGRVGDLLRSGEFTREGDPPFAGDELRNGDPDP